LTRDVVCPAEEPLLVNIHVGLDGLWCLTTLLAIFQLYRGSQLYWWGGRRVSRKSLKTHNVSGDEH
jgi:hypothetical protein